ncbi:MAG: translation initiation factor IF-2 [Candidatus Omnitrophica bacterium]|nr:translation initiation factor IF-2 [Candidatus Omnitrophota bacterium]
MTIRVHKLAKELGISSKELIEKLHKLKVDVKGHMSALDDDTAALVKGELGAKPKPRPLETKGGTKAKPKKRAKRSPEPVEGRAKRSPEPVEKQSPELVEGEEIVEEEPPKKDLKILKVDFPIAVKDLAVKLQIKPNELIKRLLGKKILVTINQGLNEENAGSIAEEFGYGLKRLPSKEELLVADHDIVDASKLKPRAPIVTFMGHVDHGKTSLLDMIRKTKVVDKEAGGITQHIGAYEVALKKGKVTFLDTPGHAAFTAMRARGANATDVVVLVVAADDGIMPQTIEAIDHAKAANVPIVVAINKIDKQNINIDKVKKQLAGIDLNPEDWGGKTITIGVSAKTGQGIDDLLELLILEAEMLELKADPDRPATGIVVEAELSKGKGPVATVLVSQGTLNIGDAIMAGLNYGKVKAMFDDKGHRVDSAGPAKPVEILGLSGVPFAGEKFYVVKDEKEARDIVIVRRMEADKKKLEAGSQKITLEDLYNKIQAGEFKELKIILKADVQGSLEAIKDSLLKLSTDEVRLSVIHGQVGNVNESDVMLASASNAVILGFHVAMTPNAKALAKQEGVDVRSYNIIYEAVNDVKAAMEGMLEPVTEETFLGRADVKQVFKVSKVGIVAGCYVSKGSIPRNAVCKLIRGKDIVFKGKISSLKHVKDDIKEAREGFECGISLGIKDIKKGDAIEAIEIRTVARRLK